MAGQSFSWTEIALVAGAVALLVVLTTLSVQRTIDSWQRRRRSRRAERGESRARRLLERAGFTIEAEQLVHSWPVTYGQQVLSVSLKADYVVRRGKQRFVAEVKSGSVGANVVYGPTRRQLLEYQLAFRTNGVLLVDAGSAEVHEVTFPDLYR
ncbi:MAG TPA: hypothetical protein VER33_02445 [Polyangiaceae bacterium]|nr:hypothetical protein [Polyangiaceae bacterium]